jgi:hypothetical protein
VFPKGKNFRALQLHNHTPFRRSKCSTPGICVQCSSSVSHKHVWNVFIIFTIRNSDDLVRKFTPYLALPDKYERHPDRQNWISSQLWIISVTVISNGVWTYRNYEFNTVSVTVHACRTLVASHYFLYGRNHLLQCVRLSTGRRRPELLGDVLLLINHSSAAEYSLRSWQWLSLSKKSPNCYASEGNYVAGNSLPVESILNQLKTFQPLYHSNIISYVVLRLGFLGPLFDSSGLQTKTY